MQAALSFPSSFLSVSTPARPLVLPRRDMPRLLHTSPNCPSIKATPAVNDSSTADYSSNVSVFPAEACETLGGDACDADMYPEVKLKPDTESEKVKTSSELIEREYLDYDGSKTVFPGEACDDLGGEFCEPEYQTGVY
ncbi:hypothetical protein LWI29_022933 [Acer saccharum]|uniref:Light-regulated protein n=1 Tax=Acer saccharum TaxID=4024 RepID=A0AA39VVL2_ACESA|nr:hypothetical protein LWI29_022933 [Acer saccharum]KAK1570532.1 hypothetical protein Q3G72_003267 [Acer saccharum]KAK1571607.1 hypothetical protein Q3G72_020006 [Acer saccharum]